MNIWIYHMLITFYQTFKHPFLYLIFIMPLDKIYYDWYKLINLWSINLHRDVNCIVSMTPYKPYKLYNIYSWYNVLDNISIIELTIISIILKHFLIYLGFNKFIKWGLAKFLVHFVIVSHILIKKKKNIKEDVVWLGLIVRELSCVKVFFFEKWFSRNFMVIYFISFFLSSY